MADLPLTDNAEPVELSLAPGFFSEQTDRGAKGRWKDGNRVRFKDSLPQKLGGWAEALISGAAVEGIDRAEWEWASLDGQPWIAQGTNSKLYLINRGIRYDITPLRRAVTLTNPFTTTSGSAIVSVEDADHGAEQGDFVRFSGATAVGGLTIDGEYQITAVQDGSHYTITASSPASSSATGGGSVMVEYDINVGLESASQAHGWGTCTYGTGTYGTRRGNCSGLTLPLRIWSLDNFGEDLIASPRGGAVYWWDRTTGPTSRAVLLPDAPRTNERVLISDSGDQIICLGAYDEVAASSDKMFIRVGAVGSLTEFTITDDEENTVFEERLSTGSYIIDGKRTRSGIFIQTDTAQYLMQPDPDQIFRIGKIGQGNSTMGPNATVDVDGTIYTMAHNKFMTFDGVYREIPCPVWGRVFDAESFSPDPSDDEFLIQNGIDVEQGDKVYCFLNKGFSEVWWFYPSPGGAIRVTVPEEERVTTAREVRAVLGIDSENDRYVIFNYSENLWYYGVIERTAMSTGGLSYGKDVPFGSDPRGAFWLHETGEDDGDLPMAEYIESFDVQMGEGKQSMHVSQFIPDMKRLAGTMQITLKAKSRPQGTAYKIFGPYSFTADTGLVGVRAAGRQMAVRFSTADLGTDWRLGDGTFETQPDAERQ